MRRSDEILQTSLILVSIFVMLHDFGVGCVYLQLWTIWTWIKQVLNWLRFLILFYHIAVFKLAASSKSLTKKRSSLINDIKTGLCVAVGLKTFFSDGACFSFGLWISICFWTISRFFHTVFGFFFFLWNITGADLQHVYIYFSACENIFLTFWMNKECWKTFLGFVRITCNCFFVSDVLSLQKTFLSEIWFKHVVKSLFLLQPWCFPGCKQVSLLCKPELVPKKNNQAVDLSEPNHANLLAVVLANTFLTLTKVWGKKTTK